MNVRVARAAWALGRGVRCRSSASSFLLPPSGAVDVEELLRDATAAEEGPREASVRRLPGQCSVLLFPGQGSQVVGMGRGLLRYPRVRELYAAAHRVLGYDLLELSLYGPQEALDRTVHCQPAVFVASLAAVEKLHHLQPAVRPEALLQAGENGLRPSSHSSSLPGRRAPTSDLFGRSLLSSHRAGHCCRPSGYSLQQTKQGSLRLGSLHVRARR